MRKFSDFLFVLYEFIVVFMGTATGFSFTGNESIDGEVILAFCIMIVHNAFTIWYSKKTTIKPYWAVIILVPALITMSIYGWSGIDGMIDYYRNWPNHFWSRGVCLTLFAFTVIACRIAKTVIIFRKFHSSRQQ